MKKAIFLFCCIILWWEAAVCMEAPLVVVVGKDGYVVDGPHCNLGRYPLNADIFEPLVTFDPQLNLQPALAVRWQYMGNRTWRFWLRKNVRFHDSAPFDSEAVRSFFTRQSNSGSKLFELEGIKIRSSRCIDFITPKENRLLPFILSHPYLGIGRDGNPPIGTGPLKFSSYRNGQYLEVQRNGDYWGPPAKEARVRFRFRTDRNGRLLDILSGEVDVVTDLPWEALAEIKNRKECRLHATARGTYVGLLVNSTGILKEPEVRRALLMGIDRKTINQVIWNGLGETRPTFIDRAFLGTHGERLSPLPYAPQKARRLLKERKLSLTLVAGFPNADAHGMLPELLVHQFSRLGIETKIVSVSDMGLYHRRMKQHDGDLWLEKGNLNSADLTFLPHLLFHPDGYYPGQLRMPAGSGTFCTLLAQASGAQTHAEIRKYTAMALDEIIGRQALFIPLATLPNLMVAKPDVVMPPLHPTLLAMRWAKVGRTKGEQNR